MSSQARKQFHLTKPPLRIGAYLLVLLLVLATDNLKTLSAVLGIWVLAGMLTPSVKLKKTAVLAFFLCGGIFLGNLFWGTGRVLVEIGPFLITDRALTTAAERALKVAALVFSAKVLFAGMPSRLAQELRWILAPFRKAGINTEAFVCAIEETLQALPEVQQQISKRASAIRQDGASKVKALGLAIYETFIQELQNQ
jgi:energy-coupling factor transporter transmembrane protein EcfT